ncbi:hypothetical protein OYG11_11190, partial [Actinobacillus pleuropneumoniae]|nr:hypothetical protein [Actinobacillus pleuropneumoniae]
DEVEALCQHIEQLKLMVAEINKNHEDSTDQDLYKNAKVVSTKLDLNVNFCYFNFVEFTVIRDL